MIVQIHSVVLLNIADALTRSSDNTTGVLLGFINQDKLVIVTSFEIAEESPQYLQSRYNLFKDVYPQCSVIGIYQIHGKDFKKLNGLSIDQPVFLSFDESFQPEGYINGEQVKIVIDSSETEVITTNTIDNNKDYYTVKSKPKEQMSLSKYNENMAITLSKLHDRLEKILETPGLDKEIVELANSLHFTGDKDDHSIKLQTAQLALITEQIANLERDKLSIVKAVLVHEANRGLV
ncbi:LOW QUALITY PROTEIN: hypothetical protein SBY92_001145 [Candida maltosa Xu316]